jgi:hypothetical protein
MLATVQDDHLALTFDVGSLAYLNVGMDISAIDLDGVGGPFGTTEPVFRLSLYDSPGGVFSITSPGTLLDQVEVMGTGTASASVFDWTPVVGALSASGSQDGHVSLDIDLLQGVTAPLTTCASRLPTPPAWSLSRQRGSSFFRG